MTAKIILKGGQGSGNHGHTGRPGKVGGSGGRDYGDVDVEARMILWSDEATAVREEAATLFEQLREPWGKEYTAVMNYQQRDFIAVNKRLRSGGKPTVQITNIDKAIASSRTKEDMYVYRGMRDNLPTGDFKDLGFMSTSLTKHNAAIHAAGKFWEEDYTKVLRLRIPAGTPAMYLGSWRNQEAKQLEVLLPRGLSFKHVGGNDYEMVQE